MLKSRLPTVWKSLKLIVFVHLVSVVTNKKVSINNEEI